MLYTESFQGRYRLFDGYEIHFRSLRTGKKTDGKNFFKILKYFSKKFNNYSHLFVPNQEIAILEALSLKEHDIGVNTILVENFLKKNHTKIDEKNLEEIVKYRYIRPLNRLRAIARDRGYEDLYQKTLRVTRTS